MNALHEVSNGLISILKPPRRVSVSEAAAAHLLVSESALWDATLVPYMIRPMDETTSRHHSMVCFVGPARTGKTLALILGRWVYTVVCHPQDFAVIHSSQDLARDFSNRDLFRLHRHSPAMRAAMTGKSRDDNTYDKTYRSGIIGVIAWPSDAQLASRTIPVMLLTDYDRWPRAIGGRSPLVQAQKRTETAGSLAMTVVESSPGTEVSLEWNPEPVTYTLGKPLSHAFPPSVSAARANIAEVYNGGTMEWWYVPCQMCGEYYPQNPSIDRFSWGADDDPIAAAQSAGTVCCWCGAIHAESTKRTENTNGRWLAEGEVIDCYGKISGTSRKGRTYPSFSLGGGAAAYQSRISIVQKYLQARKTAHETGDESGLKGVINDDIGAPHISIHLLAGRPASAIRRRADSALKKRMVPEGCWFLVVAVDVQKTRFVVQVMGYGPVRNRWVIDRFNIKYSARGNDERVDPATFDEDWALLLPLITKAYPLADGSGREMRVCGVLCDAFGREGVTDKAMTFYRRMPDAIKARFRFVKGEPKPDAPLIEQRYPDSRRRADRKGSTRGDVPILFINSNRMKDRVSGDLNRNESGDGYCHFPSWLDEWFFNELTREKRGPDGRWAGTGRNEAWDLMMYGEAGAIVGFPFSRLSLKKTGIDTPGFWANPPAWAGPFDRNSQVSGGDDPPPPPLVPSAPKEIRRQVVTRRTRV
ncbi:MAG: phage terminase large subunit family protein [Gammaproteobacteria bacterium]|nr:phage terminase large subunit family protein [Gammaproteobacteria bacterium]